MSTRFGRYELIRKLAAGGMAEIFLARQWGDASFFRDVVIKRLHRHLAEHDKTVRMFQDEARLLSQLAHPNIPQVYELGQLDGHWYLAMEYVEGANVADLWRAGAKSGQLMPLSVGLAVITQACEALHHAHERRDRAGRALRIVHRDVTPHNLMITRDGVAKLLDFGVAATSARRDTDAGVVKGTFSYMAPEQVRAKPLDKRADVFALGVILYELTTGTRLYRGTDVQVMTQIVEQDVPRPTERAAEYPPELEAIVLATLERDRARRVPSAHHLALLIEEFALRNGVPLGPRSLARWVQTVIPAEPVPEESLALVAPPRVDAEPSGEFALDDSTEQGAQGGADADDASLLDELGMLGEGGDAERFDALSDDLGERSAGDAPGPTPVVPPPSLPPELLGIPQEPQIPIDLEGIEDEDEPTARPVVLLGSPKKSVEGDEFMKDLLKRLEEESKKKED